MRVGLLGDSGGVVNSRDFCPASLKSCGCFYFWCILPWQWKAVIVNFTQPTLKAFLEAVVRMCLEISNNMLLVL